jgi:hypothetical protein
MIAVNRAEFSDEEVLAMMTQTTKEMVIAARKICAQNMRRNEEKDEKRK